MIQTNELKAMIVRRGLTQGKLAKMLGIRPETFYRKMKIGIFRNDEIQKMIHILDIENPMEIFFANAEDGKRA